MLNNARNARGTTLVVAKNFSSLPITLKIAAPEREEKRESEREKEKEEWQVNAQMHGSNICAMRRIDVHYIETNGRARDGWIEDETRNRVAWGSRERRRGRVEGSKAEGRRGEERGRGRGKGERTLRKREMQQNCERTKRGGPKGGGGKRAPKRHRRWTSKGPTCSRFMAPDRLANSLAGSHPVQSASVPRAKDRRTLLSERRNFRIISQRVDCSRDASILAARLTLDYRLIGSLPVVLANTR